MHRMSDGTSVSRWIGIAIFQSLHPSQSQMCPRSRSSYLNSEGRGRDADRAKTKKEVPSSLPPLPRALQTNLRFSRRHLRRPSVGGGRRARAWPHLPHSSSPEDTAEFEVTATNLGERERWRDAYDFHLRIQLCRCQGIQKCYGITCDA